MNESQEGHLKSLDVCPNCGAKNPRISRYGDRTHAVEERPLGGQPSVLMVLHRYRCVECGKHFTSLFPKDVDEGFDPGGVL